MNEPIISPWLIYVASLIDTLLEGLKFVTAACLVVGIILGVGFVDGSYYKEEKVKYSKALKVLIIVCVTSFLLATFIPDQDTIWKMWLASKVTPESVQEAGAVTADVAQKALDLIADSAIKILQEAKK